MYLKGILALLLVGVACGVVAGSSPDRRAANDEGYPYRSPQFTQMVLESHTRCRPGETHDFYGWLERAYRRTAAPLIRTKKPGLEAALETKRQELFRITDRSKRADAEAAFGAALHRMVKQVIPRFSLDRGFEFCSVIRYGERQCFLQAVLIAGMLQRAGADAGVVMVYQNPHGRESNNGHAVTLLRLANGQHVLVDASEPEPFPRQQGLFVRCGDYQYVEPVFDPRSARILRYRLASGRGEVATSRVSSLDLRFVRSMFWYYRGERQPGALLSRSKTAPGLAAARHDLQKSVEWCARNPLAVYMLGRVYLAEGKDREAGRQIARGFQLYSRFGWVPSGPKQYYLLASRRRGSTAQSLRAERGAGNPGPAVPSAQ
jgi:hypothetical protein